MKRIIIIITLLIQIGSASANGGIPFFVNYSSAQYKAHNRNFDVICDNYGTVYIANFEGLLYYDQSEWRIIHTPGISRITSLFKDKTGLIWIGGYNLFGYIESSANGALGLKLLHSDANTSIYGEVAEIMEVNNKITFKTSNGKCYVVDGEKLRKTKDLVDDNKNADEFKGYKVNQRLTLKNGYTFIATEGNGLVALDKNGKEYFTLSEKNGLCNNNINKIAYNEKGELWGVTDDGVFCADFPSVYSQFSSSEGLKGEVSSIYCGDDCVYVGTLQGLYRKTGNNFLPVAPITQACWQLLANNGTLYAATADGLFSIKDNSIKLLTHVLTLAVVFDKKGGLYTGELNGIFYNSNDGKRVLVDSLEKVNQFLQSEDGAVWARTMYGQIYCKKNNEQHFKSVSNGSNNSKTDIEVLYRDGNSVCLADAAGIRRWNTGKSEFEWIINDEQSMNSISFPQYTYTDSENNIWSTDEEGKNLFVADNLLIDSQKFLNELFPARSITIRNICIKGSDVWIGGTSGLLYWQSDKADTGFNDMNNLYIRTIKLDNDSIVWGGYMNSDNGPLIPRSSFQKLVLDSDHRDITITFSSDCTSSLGKTEYRYRLSENSEWSEWNESTEAKFSNLSYGNYTFQVEGRDKYGRVIQSVSFRFVINPPLYLRWYSLLMYFVLFILLVIFIVQQRMRYLVKEKLRLEEIVEQRTSLLKQRNEEVEEKSKSLEVALADLSKAQNDLIRQEKMATVGSLTKGLIDRILNPMNYINNFSHLSQGLIKDIREDIEDEKDNMTPDNYDDSLDILDMLHSNLEKIEGHGMNTTRILKAMEEMLKNRSGNMRHVDLAAICRKDFEMLNSYYADIINACNIKTELSINQEIIEIYANAEQFSKTIMSLLGNSIYAVNKKYGQQPYDGMINFNIDLLDDEKVRIVVRDNGIGIEETIIDKIFDPFFTTKTTAEAAGVGLYLSKEIVLNHNGTITVDSCKGEYTEFVITLPVKQDDVNDTEIE